MPSLFRFLLFIGIAAALAFAAIWGLATFGRPITRPMTEPVVLKNLPAPVPAQQPARPAGGTP